MGTLSLTLPNSPFLSPRTTGNNASAASPRPRHVIEAMRAVNLGRPLSSAHRKKLSEVRRRLGIRPPKAGRLWTRDWHVIYRTPANAVKRTGRTLSAVYTRRSELSVRDGRQMRGKRGRNGGSERNQPLA